MDRESGLRVTEIWGFEGRSALKIPLVTSRVAAGFPSPAGDFIDKTVSWNGVKELPNVPVRLRFQLVDADLYSFHF